MSEVGMGAIGTLFGVAACALGGKAGAAVAVVVAGAAVVLALAFVLGREFGR